VPISLFLFALSLLLGETCFPRLAPPYPPLLANATKSRPIFTATESIDEFLVELAERMGYILPGGIPDKQRAATWFVEWWRNSAAEVNSLGGTPDWGWGLDCQWNYDPFTHLDQEDSAADAIKKRTPTSPGTAEWEKGDRGNPIISGPMVSHGSQSIEERFNSVIERHLRNAHHIDDTPSEAQLRKREREENRQRREQRRVEVSSKRAQTQKRRSR
jgi:hypothetical protein